MNAFDVCGPLPTGTTVLEASAGTGKTFTIAALTARYVAENKADLSQIMLVTFGNAASRELRDRVRERLVSAERGLRAPAAARADDSDTVLRLLADAPDDEVEVRRGRLARALAGFDEATIATTHSFCSQMLAGLGMAADADPAAAFVEDISDLVREVVDDLYVRTFSKDGSGPPFLSHADLLDLGRRAVGSDRQAQLWPLSDDGLPGRRRKAAEAVRREVERRKRRLGLVDYDDWLSLLRDALTDPTSGAVACDRVSSRFRVVMVDEFQDTDPVQWEILERAFHGRTNLVLIGDPKQAIYAFRGGDVTTYLAAAAEADSAATLGTNWRSDAPLLDALDLLLGGAALGHERIVVRPVEAAHPHPRLTGAGAPLRLRRLRRRGRGQGFSPVGRVREAVACDVVADIVDLLSGGAEYEGRPVEPGDLAVLVRTNDQGHLIRTTLRRAGVPAVFAGGGSVFATPDAVSWLRLLEAMEQPHRAGRVRSAALSVFLGHDETTLDERGDDLADELGPRLRGWADLLADRGVAAFFEVLTATEGLPARVLARPDGERVLTDLRHIGQVLHAAAQRESLGLTALVEWLRRRIAQASTEVADERSRRLESDAAAVQVMTVHVSKGLEFPVVYVPFAWDRFVFDDPQVLRLHDDEGRRVLDVGGSGGAGYAGALARHLAEESGEDLRLLYVALTRARCQVVAHWAPSRTTAAGPLNRLLFGAAEAGAEPAARVLPPPDDDAAAVLDSLATRSGGTIEVAEIPERPVPRWQPPVPPAPELSVSRFTRTLDEEWRRTSYSALTRAAHDAAHDAAHEQLGSEPDEPGTEDERDVVPPVPEEPPADALPSPLGDLPGGAAFGTLVHDVLEDLDPAALDERCAEAVARHLVPGVDAAALADGLRPVLATPLDGTGLTLGSIPAADRLAELDFELPLAGGDAAVPHATLADVAAVLRRYDLGPLTGYPDLLAGLEPAALRGFLTGSIDAVLRLPGPVFAVVDHKTNRLGAEPLSTWHYRSSAMAEEMQRTHYVLQALLYCVALHRYLRWRLPGYDPDRHLGPVLYLFVRGMAGPKTPAGAGVFSWTPPPGLVPELSDLLAGRP